jgi:hypothetical protein
MPLTQITTSSIANGAVTLAQLAPSATPGPKITQIQITNSGGTVLDDTAISLSGGYIKITGTGFAAGAQVIVNNTPASSTTFTSTTVLNAQVGAQVAGTYAVYVVNTDGGVAIAVNGLTYSSEPSWVTGTVLTSVNSGSAYSLQLNATGATSYIVAAGSTLPTGLTLSSSGLLSGTVTVGSSTTYSFTINAIDGELQDSPRTFSLSVNVAPTTIGQAFGGGFYAGQISTTGNGVATHYLIVAPKATGQASTNRLWKTTDTATAGTSSVIDGFANSEAMNNASHPAALFCRGLSIGGFTDWYLPAKNEIEILYYNLRPTSVNNFTGGNTNPNAVPPRSSNYSASVPGQTSATAFQSGGSEAFPPDAFWSSTEFSTTDAWRQGFENGYAINASKLSSFTVRAVRKVPV